MARYRPVDVRLWDDRKFLACSDGARLLWVFLLTCPSLPIPGIVVGGDAALAELIGWSPELFRERLGELFQAGLQVAREGRILWLKNALKYQPPMNPNMVKGWAQKWDDIPEGNIKLEVWEALRIACKTWNILFAKLFQKPLGLGSCNGLPNGSGNRSTHEHEHEHEHEHDTEKIYPALARAIPPAPDPEPPPATPPRAPMPLPGAPRPEPTLDAIWAEFEAARAKVGTELRVEITRLTAHDPGRADLAAALSVANTAGRRNDEVAAARKAIAVAAAEAIAGKRELRWLSGVIFEPRNYRALCASSVAEARRPRAARPGEASAPVRKPDPGPVPITIRPEDRMRPGEASIATMLAAAEGRISKAEIGARLFTNDDNPDDSEEQQP
jgi:hypothetical protein